MTPAGSPYSAAHARSSLLQFAIGKVLSATLGVAVLLVSLHLLATADFGRYVAVVALLEIFYLVTGLGLSTIAQRYVAEYRIRATHVQFRRFIHGIVARRAAYAVLGALVLFIAVQAWSAMGYSPPPSALQPGLYALLVTGCMTRYLDEVFPALLLQGYTQGLVLVGHLVRLSAMLGIAATDASLGFVAMLHIEIAAALTMWLIGMGLLQRFMRAAATAAADQTHHVNTLIPGIARRFYLVQVLGQAWGTNTAKLIVSHQLGLASTASYGFLQAITDMMRNYLPAYLLSNWLRPLMIARHLRGGGMHDISAMAGVVLKLSLMLVTPVAAFFLACGDPFVAWISNGKFTTGGAVLASLCILMGLQCLHLVVGMIALTLEQANASVRATIASCMALPLCIAGPSLFGVQGVVFGMIIGECIWIGTALWVLRHAGLNVAIDYRGCSKLLAAAVPAFLAIVALPASMPLFWLCATGLAVAFLVFGITSSLWKPFQESERAFVLQLIPRRLFFW